MMSASLPPSPRMGSVSVLTSDNIMSYYESDDAGHTYTPSTPDQEFLKSHVKEISADTVSSDYSVHSDAGEGNSKPTPLTNELLAGSRRPGARSERGTDRRRLAIVQMDSSTSDISQQGHSGRGYTSDFPPSSLRSRRGFGTRLDDLALVVPPDASPRSYAHLTPPSTAPVSGDRTRHEWATKPNSHHRSQSDALSHLRQGDLHYQPSRDVGIVGTETSSSNNHKLDKPKVFSPPIFQPSQDLFENGTDPSRLPVSALDDSTPTKSAGKLPILTPEIGQEKDPSVAVAPPIVLNLGALTQPLITRKLSSRAATSGSHVQPTSPYPPSTAPPHLNGHPGVHTARAHSPPPRAAINVPPNSPPPPRPPRLLSPLPHGNRGDVDSVTQSLQLPTSLSAIDPQSSSSSLGESLISFKEEDTSRSKTDIVTKEPTESTPHHPATSVHRREGAFPPSVLLPADSSTVNPGIKSTHSEDVISDLGVNTIDTDIANASRSQTSTTIEPPSVTKDTSSQQRQGITQSDVAMLPREQTPSSDPGGRSSSDLSPPPSTRSTRSKSHKTNTPSPPPKSSRSFKSSLVNLKRFSALPRPPSAVSESSTGLRTPSPSSVPSLPISVQKIQSQWPAAMECYDIVTRRNTLDRCAGYAQKINELYICDCGLNNWLTETRYKVGLTTQRSTIQNVFGSSGLSVGTGGQPRQTSASSIISDVTFPRRLDASLATDLSTALMEDITVPTAPPPLPYPSLAQNQRWPTRTPSSMRSLPSPTVPSKASSFFSSLGRKASVKKSEKSNLNPSHSLSAGKLLVKNPPAITAPRPVNIVAAPTFPGGPRAPPYRAQRSQTMMISSRFKSSTPSHDPSLARRPSLNELSPSEPVVGIQVDPEFIRQVDKLAAILPRANREVLAGYLRRSGQDILAIGQYLEDEKNGTIRYR